VFSGFTDLIDGIILNMKFGGWMIGFSLLVGGFGIIYHVCLCKGTDKSDRIQKSLEQKINLFCFNFF
jgi:putative ABC transport system permease protein